MTKPADTKKPEKPTKTLDELKIDATNQLKKILTQGKNIKDFPLYMTKKPVMPAQAGNHPSK